MQFVCGKMERTDFGVKLATMRRKNSKLDRKLHEKDHLVIRMSGGKVLFIYCLLISLQIRGVLKEKYEEEVGKKAFEIF